MGTLTNREWWNAAGVRAIKTFAQSFAASITGFTVFSEINFKVVISSAFLAALFSLMTSLGGLPEVSTEGSDSK